MSKTRHIAIDRVVKDMIALKTAPGLKFLAPGMMLTSREVFRRYEGLLPPDFVCKLVTPRGVEMPVRCWWKREILEDPGDETTWGEV